MRRSSSTAEASAAMIAVDAPEIVAELEISLSTRGELPFYYPVRDALRRLEPQLIAAGESEPYTDLVVTVTRRR